MDLPSARALRATGCADALDGTGDCCQLQRPVLACERHPTCEVTGACARCSAFVCPNCLVEVEGDTWCLVCAPRLTSGSVPAWELHIESAPRAWFATASQVLRDPREFFDGFPRGGTVEEPLRFHVFGLGVAGLPGAIATCVIFGLFAALEGPDALGVLVGTGLRFVFSGLIALGVAFATTHGAARLAGSRARVEDTFRALSYVWGSAWPILAVPAVGWLAGPPLLWRGAREALRGVHDLRGARATLVALLGVVTGVAAAAALVVLG